MRLRVLSPTEKEGFVGGGCPPTNRRVLVVRMSWRHRLRSLLMFAAKKSQNMEFWSLQREGTIFSWLGRQVLVRRCSLVVFRVSCPPWTASSPLKFSASTACREWRIHVGESRSVPFEHPITRSAMPDSQEEATRRVPESFHVRTMACSFSTSCRSFPAVFWKSCVSLSSHNVSRSPGARGL